MVTLECQLNYVENAQELIIAHLWTCLRGLVQRELRNEKKPTMNVQKNHPIGSESAQNIMLGRRKPGTAVAILSLLLPSPPLSGYNEVSALLCQALLTWLDRNCETLLLFHVCCHSYNKVINTNKQNIEGIQDSENIISDTKMIHSCHYLPKPVEYLKLRLNSSNKQQILGENNTCLLILQF